MGEASVWMGTQILAIFLAVLLNQKVQLSGFWRTAFYLPAIVSGVAGAVLWNSSQPVMRALALAVQARGLPAIDLDSHGCLSTYLHGHFEADPAALHTISSPEYCEFLRHYEYPGTLHPLGRPQYDSWNRIDKQLMRRALGLPGHLPISLRTSTWTHPMSAWSRMEECFIEPEGASLNAMLATQKVTPVAVIYSIRPELGVAPQGMSKSLAEAGRYEHRCLQSRSRRPARVLETSFALTDINSRYL